MRSTPVLRAMPLLALALALLASVASSVPLQAADASRRPQESVKGPSAEELVRLVEKRYAGMRTLTASFTQTFRSGELGQSVTERGRIFVRRPGQMRWDYREPDKKIFLVQPGGTTLSYLPADLRAVRGKLPQDAPHLDLLMGQSDLLSSFAATEVTLKDPAFPGSRALKLVPRKGMDGVEMVYLEIEPRMMTVERVLVLDNMGNESDLVLDKVVENAAVKADVFEVRIPPSVTVQDAGAGPGR